MGTMPFASEVSNIKRGPRIEAMPFLDPVGGVLRPCRRLPRKF